MGWTKPHCLFFDRVRLTRHIGTSKTEGGKGGRCYGGPCDANECEKDQRAIVRFANCERKLEKEAGKRKRLDLTVSSKKKKTQLSTSAENSTAAPKNSTTVPKHSAVPENSTAVPENSDVVPEKIFLPPKESKSAFQKAYKIFDLPNDDSSLGIKEFLLLRKEETIFIFRNELKTYKAFKVSKWVHCIYSKETDAGKMIKNVELKTPNNEVCYRKLISSDFMTTCLRK
ncbi:hypothetical protein TNIN_1481 [Trichonephila inaurata madagascariensis]|uniref:Uncharacterized protein n=1 Tax=Trichonephila inaurata madagascariensis TaxID=2747483 RepID=A0A8X6X865_9ARAC|nr:hypothetical protein TNIN_1481 [Trichonephila inaurata madagascariensis]